MTERDPRMLPGMTASAATTLAVWVVLGGCVIAIAVFVWAALAQPFSDDIILALSATFGLFLVWMAIMALTIPFANRRERAELRAGYTTLVGRHGDVDHIDAKTGVVILSAPEPRAAIPAGSITSGSELGAIELAHGPLGVALRTPLAVIFTVLGVVIFAVAIAGVVAVIDTYSPAIIGFGLLMVLGFLVVLLAPLYAIAMLPQRGYLRLFPMVTSGRRVWLTFAKDDLRNLTSRLASPAESKGFARAQITSYAVVERDRLSFWSRSRRRILPFLVIPRARIASARLGDTIDANNRRVPAAVLRIVTDDGVETEFSLPLGPNSALTPLASATEMQQAAELLVRWQTSGSLD